MCGGDVGIDNARKVYAEHEHKIELPPTGDVRMGRNRIRQVFLAKESFAAPELTFVRDLVEFGRGKLEQIVNTFTS
ncbi:hypothetical protein BG015_008958 [Linnemannia schmuckeri]|uniref:Uncharacterized protein n=1 Tax=Linnemannia schmuckeri TaxID=64567 RepID=A0A9P5RWL2_9FUNG|nr:hypothetical protein BG015_008958 [Linnemannia schmuckeri]